ncbi:unnamed protein product [Calypogeia fissa]
MVLSVEFTAYATLLSEKWDSIRAEDRRLVEFLHSNVEMIQGLPDDIVRDHVWPLLHLALITDAGNDVDTVENIKFLLSLMGFNKKWHQIVSSCIMFGVLRMMQAEFLELQNPLTDNDGMRFVQRLMDSFPNMHLLGSLDLDDLAEFWVNWSEWDLLDRAFLCWS